MQKQPKVEEEEGEEKILLLMLFFYFLWWGRRKSEEKRQESRKRKGEGYFSRAPQGRSTHLSTNGPDCCGGVATIVKGKRRRRRMPPLKANCLPSTHPFYRRFLLLPFLYTLSSFPSQKHSPTQSLPLLLLYGSFPLDWFDVENSPLAPEKQFDQTDPRDAKALLFFPSPLPGKRLSRRRKKTLNRTEDEEREASGRMR